ncbi:hypothetical protein ABW21_db0201146 [Orbilia brochopaga]|nr:hypothetical protein ABW21_db0201146 [Drechslerella brochopaga]
MESQSPSPATEPNESSYASEAVNSDAFVDSLYSDTTTRDDSVLADILGSEAPRVRRRRPNPILLESPLRRTDPNKVAGSHPTTTSEGQHFFRNPVSDHFERGLYPLWEPPIWDPRWQGYRPRKIDFAAESADERALKATPSVQELDSRHDPWLFVSEISPTPVVSICESIDTYGDLSDDDHDNDHDDISIYSYDLSEELPSMTRDLNLFAATDLRVGPSAGPHNFAQHLKSPSKRGAPGSKPSSRRNSAQRESWKRHLRRSGTPGRGIMWQEPTVADEYNPMEGNASTENIVEASSTSSPQATKIPGFPTLEPHGAFRTLQARLELEYGKICDKWQYFITHGGVTALVVLSWAILLILAQTNILQVSKWKFFNSELRDMNSRYYSGSGQSYEILFSSKPPSEGTKANSNPHAFSGTRIENDWRPDPRDIVKLMFSKNESQTVMDSKILYHLQSIEERQGILNRKTQKQLDDATLVLDTMAREIKHLHMAFTGLVNGKQMEREVNDLKDQVRYYSSLKTRQRVITKTVSPTITVVTRTQVLARPTTCPLTKTEFVVSTKIVTMLYDNQLATSAKPGRYLPTGSPVSAPTGWLSGMFKSKVILQNKLL